MERFFDEFNAWIDRTVAQVGTGVDSMQRAALVAIVVLVILAAVAYLMGFLRLQYFQYLTNSWVGMVVTGLFLLFVVAPLLLLLIA